MNCSFEVLFLDTCWSSDLRISGAVKKFFSLSSLPDNDNVATLDVG